VLFSWLATHSNLLGGRKDVVVIHDFLLTTLNQWKLDLDKLVGFGSNGTTVMTRCRIRVAGQLKEDLSPFHFNDHCVAYQTNLTSLNP
jgi:hypothetical protein